MSIKVMAQVWATSTQKGSALLLLLAIADHAHDDGSGAYPSVATLAHKTRMGERQTRFLVGRLAKSGEIAVEKNAGPGGVNLYRVCPPAGVQTLHPALARTTTPAEVRTSPLQPTAPRTISEPSVEPSKVAAASPQPFEVHTPAAEEKATVHEADVLWMAERSRKGIDRFTDPKARANLRLSAKRALRHGVWQDIKDAILVHAPNPDANPWYLDEWTRVAAGQRREVEGLQRKIAERAKNDNELRRHYARGTPKHISQFIPAVLSDASA